MNDSQGYAAAGVDSQFEQATFQPIKPHSNAKRWQFSVRSMLIGMTLAATILAMIVAPVLGFFVLMGIGFCAAVFLTCSIFYGRGWIRPFAITGIIPLLILPFTLASAPGSPEEFCVITLVFYAISIFTGLSGAAAHGFLKRRSGIVPVPNIPIIRNLLSND